MAQDEEKRKAREKKRNMLKKSAWLMMLLLILNVGVSPGVARSGNDLLTVNLIDFKLFRNHDNYSLQYCKNERLLIPVTWLIPTDEVQEDEQCYVSSFHYDEPVTSFKIGDGRIGLHLSSYKIQKRGSAQAAAGRDVFLVFDPEKLKLHPGGLKLGVTKSRVRVMGCFSAMFHCFVIGDINRDGLIDIGVVKEELKCKWVNNVPVRSGPFYEQLPIRWHIYMGAHWKYEPVFDGKSPPKRHFKLPLINLVKSPIDFVKEKYEK